MRPCRHLFYLQRNHLQIIDNFLSGGIARLRKKTAKAASGLHLSLPCPLPQAARLDNFPQAIFVFSLNFLL